MKFSLLMFAAALCVSVAQISPGTQSSIVVTASNTKITAVAWTGINGSLSSSDPNALTCTANPLSPSTGWAKVTVKCQAQGYALSTVTLTLNDKLGGSAASFTQTVVGNTITMQFSKAEPVGDQWQVAANGALQSGTF